MKFIDTDGTLVNINLAGLDISHRVFYREMRKCGFDRRDVNVMIIGIVLFGCVL